MVSFYHSLFEKYLANYLEQEDFSFIKDDSIIQKLDILENVMLSKQNVIMIGDVTDRGANLFMEKPAGNMYVCISFVENKGLIVSNTLLKKNIRNIIVIHAENLCFFKKLFGEKVFCA